MAQPHPISPRSVALTSRVLAEHAGSAPLAFAPSALGRAYTLAARRPAGYTLRVPAQGSRLALAATDAARADSTSVPAGSAVAIVTIRGPIEQRASEHLCGWSDGYDAIAERVTAAAEDPAAGALLLDIDSPGGVCAGLEEGAKLARAAVLASGKPCLAFANEMIGSAAYWIAAVVADSIHGPPAAEFGSVGTIALHYSVARALAAENIDVHVFADPPEKGELYPEVALSPDAAAYAQEQARYLTGRFFDAVGARRPHLTRDRLRALKARMYRGDRAIEAGLADGLGSFGEVLALAAERARAAQTTPALARARAAAPTRRIRA